MGHRGTGDNKGDMSPFQKAWEVLFPWLLYYLAYNAAYMILIFLQGVMQNSSGKRFRQWAAAHTATMSGVTGGLCMLLGFCPLLPILKRELTEWVETKKSLVVIGGREFPERSIWKEVSVTVILAVTSSLGLNALLTLTKLVDVSQTYQEVAKRQYGVVFGLGILLYGLISPLVEEAVFRGVIYNRLRRFYGPTAAVAVSGIFFGVFHGNLVQGVYGTCMGILLAYVYEREGSFFFPVLFHAAANIAVYCTAYAQVVQDILFTPVGCAVLLAAAAGLFVIFRKKNKDY